MQATQANVDYFRQQAAEAREMALRSLNPVARENWVQIATNWERLADEEERLTKQYRAKEPHH